MQLNLEAAGNRNRYEMSTAQEDSPLGWATTMANIKNAGDRQFKKHLYKFYQMDGIEGLNGFSPACALGLVLVAGAIGFAVWKMKKS